MNDAKKYRMGRSKEDMEFFEKLYCENYKMLMQLLAITLKADDVKKREEIVFQIFAEAFEHLDQLKTYENPQDWLILAARKYVRVLGQDKKRR